MNMTQLCERYLLKKPQFLNLDIEGYGTKALEGNDWSNPKCRPELIFSENNALS